jgi:2-polyprenyl-3-methyl-5-hydroxy-6-metoxy-1,4-benzoquinol methylase
MKTINYCPICKNDDTKSADMFMSDGIVYKRCSNCSVVYQNPQPEFAVTEQIYDGLHYHDRYIKSEFVYLPTSKIYLNKLEIYLKEFDDNFNIKNKKLLDIGCGVGYFLYLAKEKGANVLGADISKWAAKYAKDKFNVDVISGDFLTMDLEDYSFDIVTMWQTIEHLPNPLDFINKIYKILKPGGFFMFATPDVDSWIVKFYKKRWNCFMPNEHLVLFNFKSAEIFLKKNNLSPIKIIRIREREIIGEQLDYSKFFIIRVFKNLIMKLKPLQKFIASDKLENWKNQKDIRIPLPSIAYSVFAIGKK